MRLAYLQEALTEPITEELRKRGWEATPSNNPGADIVRRKADIALGPALDYARHLGLVDYALVPEFAVITEGIVGLMRIAFSPGRESLSSIAVRKATDASTIISGIILIEKHGIEPNVVEVEEEADLKVMLEAADGALLSGDQAIASLAYHDMALDMTDEWEDITDAPLPYMLAWGREGEVPDESIAELLEARDHMTLTFPDRIARPEQPEGLRRVYEAYLTGNIRFSLTKEEAHEILTPLFHYPFYHGVIEDIPAIKFLDDKPEQSPLTNQGEII